jgi:DNA-binding NtrC family response regulator
MSSGKLSIAEELERLRILVDQRDLDSVEATVNLLLSENCIDDLEKSELLLFQSKCRYFSGCYDQALTSIRDAISLSKSSNSHTLYAEQKFVLGRILNLTGRHDDAIEELTESYAFFRRAGDLTTALSPLMTIGLIHQTKGNLGQARVIFESIADKARDLGSMIDFVLAMFNTCRVAILSGDLNSAAVGISAVRDIVDQDVHRFRVANLSGMLAVWRLETKESRALLGTVVDSYLAKKVSRDVAVCLEYLGLNEYFAGNFAKAREYYDQVLAMPEPTASAVAQTLRMLTDVEIAEHNWDAARETAAKAEAAITKISERIELGALWRAYGHIHTHDGNHAAAREYFEKSIDLLRQLGARYELALSHFDAGRSACYSAEQRLEQLRQAKALFVDMDVPKRVAQVDHALSLLAGSISARSCGVDGQKSLTLKTAKPAPVIVAQSRAMLEIVATADRFKDCEMTILITGETGTGKDLLAEYIHYSSHRAHRPYKAINCAAIPESLLESELFGFKKGTYTGAGADKPGLIESADGGSFFFDEIGDAPLAIQAKLLRVIETKTVRRLGDNQDISVDVRFIAATNQDLKSQIEAKTFRSDLFYRLAQVHINLPPLRERREDIIPLLETFLAAAGVALTAEDRRRLLAHPNGYSWPGNVRELIAIAARVAALQDDNGNRNIVNLLLLELGIESPEAEERQRLFTSLQRHNGNKSKAADELGIPRTTLVSQLKKFNL